MTPDQDPVTALRAGLGELAGALSQWDRRDDTRPDPGARRAASAAVHEIGAQLRELHALRARLIAEIRQSDRAAEARADALLARLRDD